MDLDTALQYVAEDTLGIRVNSVDEAKRLVNRAAELGLTPYGGAFWGVPDRWSIYGLSDISAGPTFWRNPSDFARPHDIVDFCDLVSAPIDSIDIQNLL